MPSERRSDGKSHRVNSHQAGVLKWTIGDRSQLTFSKLWLVVRGWECFLYITRTRMRPSRLTTICAYALRWKVYPCVINDAEATLPSRARLEESQVVVRRRTGRMLCDDELRECAASSC
ncbi:MAG: hypothetical protein AAFV28_02060 [Cyanobacteria bacterium J06635_13]